MPHLPLEVNNLHLLLISLLLNPINLTLQAILRLKCLILNLNNPLLVINSLLVHLSPQILNGFNLKPGSDESCFSCTKLCQGEFGIIISRIETVHRYDFFALTFLLDGPVYHIVIVQSQVITQP